MVIVRVFRFFVGWTFKSGLILVGLLALYGFWDFSQQRSAADGEYTVSEYASTVKTRHTDEIAFLQTTGRAARGQFDRLFAKVVSSEMYQSVGLPSVSIASAAPDLNLTVDTVEDAVLAEAQTAYAPNLSLLPRARGSE